ncbi:MAG TPA: hypothetical protein VGV35_16965 [Bryobacteraceae bacterium]|nr:hypothetical protein [Bryobacteraceae bacterium]
MAGRLLAGDHSASQTLCLGEEHPLRATDVEAMAKLVSSKKTDLFAPIPHGDGQTILREALLIADHNAYHVGQLVLLRRLLGAWKG